MQEGHFLSLGPGAPWSFGCCLHQVHSLKKELFHIKPLLGPTAREMSVYIVWSTVTPAQESSLPDQMPKKSHLMLTALKG